MWLVILGVLFVLIYIFIIKPQQYWEDRVLHVKPTFLFGSMAPYFFRKKSFTEVFKKIYDKYQNQRYVGFYQFLLPTLLIRDPELIKQITVKDFDTFPEHRTFISEEVDPFWGKNLFQMKGEEWKDMRATLSPVFTSSKMRLMFSLVSECAERFVNHLKEADLERSGYEFKNLFSKFTNDVVATIAFGVTCDSLADPNNEFYKMGYAAANLDGLNGLKVFGYSISPFLMKLFNIKMFNKSVTDFFSEIIHETVRMREEKGIIRQDLIHLLIEARKGRLKFEEAENTETNFAALAESQIGKDSKRQRWKFTDDDIVAQGIFFFIAGFETASLLMSFMSYELAINSDVQEKLRKEIDETAQKGTITYEAIQNMVYLDMVISETLRKWPVVPVFDRKSVKPYVLEPERPTEKRLILEKGQICWVAIFPIHRDPKYFPDPEKFDPERFNSENKKTIQPFTYIPFGCGPRGCVGSRFALLENKILFFNILLNFEIVPVEKTPLPMVLSKTQFHVQAKNGFWLGLKPRNKTL